MGDPKTILTVSLTTKAREYLDFLAEKQTNGNRSRWVERAILRSMAEGIAQEAKHTAPESGRVHGEDANKCNPNHRNGRCAICWGLDQ